MTKTYVAASGWAMPVLAKKGGKPMTEKYPNKVGFEESDKHKELIQRKDKQFFWPESEEKK